MWYRLQISTQLFIALLLGVLGMSVISAMVPYGPNKDRIGEILAIYAGGLAATLFLMIGFAYGGLQLLKSGRPVLASTAAFMSMPVALALFLMSMG